MKGQIIAILSVVSASFFYSCGSFDYGKEKPTEILVQADEPDANLAWEQDVSYIMQIKCANCHGPNHHKFAPEKAYTKFPYNFEDKDTFTKNASLIRNVIFNEEFRASAPEYAMPPNYSTPLTELEKTAIKNYLDKKLPVVATPVATPQGTPDPAGGTPGGSTVPTSLSASYTSKGCNGCHKADGSGDIGPKLIKTSKSLAEYKAKIKNGGGGMPQYSDFPDADAENDYKFFQK